MPPNTGCANVAPRKLRGPVEITSRQQTEDEGPTMSSMTARMGEIWRRWICCQWLGIRQCHFGRDGFIADLYAQSQRS